MNQSAIRAAHGMVVAGHGAASQAGARALDRGGSVVDAMVACSAALTVVLGHATSIGGDCFLLYHDAEAGRTYGLNASGYAPLTASPDRFASGIPGHGPLAPTVPGLVAAWEAMHRRFGRLPWRSLFGEAMRLAVEGHPVSRMLVTGIPTYRDALCRDAGCAELYLPGGKALAQGDLLRQPALGESLRLIAEEGAASFYSGSLAQRIAGFFEACGGLIGTQDLSAYTPVWVDPVQTAYREHRIMVMPPNSYGVLLLMQLEGLSALESAVLKNDEVARLAAQMSAMKAAFRTGVPMIGDPLAARGAVNELMSPETKAAMRTAVLSPGSSSPTPNGGGTSCVLIADSRGNAINVVQSTFHPFGSALRDPNTGILFNNRLSGFTHVPGSVNSIAPRKRPAHTLCPVMATRDGKLRYVLASPGGLSQTLTNAQVLTHLLDCKEDVATAVSSPRWCNTLSGDFLVEPDFGESMAHELMERGHVAKLRNDPYFYGSAKAIALEDSGLLAGAADHRREAVAVGH